MWTGGLKSKHVADAYFGPEGKLCGWLTVIYVYMEDQRSSRLRLVVCPIGRIDVSAEYGSRKFTIGCLFNWNKYSPYNIWKLSICAGRISFRLI